VAKVKRTLGVKNDVPTSSMADIAFLLLIFFMATTIFKMEEGLPVQLPRAEAGQRVPRQKISHVWVQNARTMTIDDNYITLVDIVPILRGKLANDPALITGLNIDQGVPWNIAAEVIEMLKEAQALNTSFTTEPEKKK
jgi:biopolymer transport protein ExbD